MSKLIVSLCTVLLLGACGEKSPQEGHGHGPTAKGEASHGHGSGAEKITHFTERTELFVEFPRLVVGEQSAFAAHLTRLSDFRALGAGKVTVLLSGGGHPDEAFAVEAPTQPGIFRPQAMPRHSGERELTIEVVTAEFSVRHVLGPVTVYADRKAADAAGDAQEDEGGIGFTKEQQWKMDFATAQTVRRPIRVAVAATGILRAPPDREALLTAPAPGQIQPAGKFPRIGQSVKKGDVLAYLVPRLGGETDLASLQAAARKARVELDQARQELARMESLYKDEAVPEKRVLAARAAEESARAEFDATQERIGQYSGAGGGVPIRAPVSGTVAEVRVSPGAFAQEGALLFHVADRSVLWVELRVSESDAARLASPSGTSFHVDGVEEAFAIDPGRNGRLVAIGGAVDPETRTLPVVFEFTAPDQRLRIGMSVKAQVFQGGAKEVLAIPASAVLDESGVTHVFVMIGGESFERKPVRLGARDGDWVEVTEGLEPGQRVVSRGAYLVKLAATKTGDIGHGHAH